jgi:hypothetical protein
MNMNNNKEPKESQQKEPEESQQPAEASMPTAT